MPVAGCCREPLRGEWDCGVSREEEEPFLAELEVEFLMLPLPPARLTMAMEGSKAALPEASPDPVPDVPPPRRREPRWGSSGAEREERRPFRNVEVRKLVPQAVTPRILCETAADGSGAVVTVEDEPMASQYLRQRRDPRAKDNVVSLR